MQCRITCCADLKKTAYFSFCDAMAKVVFYPKIKKHFFLICNDQFKIY